MLRQGRFGNAPQTVFPQNVFLIFLILYQPIQSKRPPTEVSNPFLGLQQPERQQQPMEGLKQTSSGGQEINHVHESGRQLTDRSQTQSVAKSKAATP